MLPCCFSFYVLVFWLQDMWDLSSPTGYRTVSSAWKIKSLSLGCQESPKYSVFYPKFSMHSSVTVPLTTFEKCAEIGALLSLLLWEGNRMEIMTSLEPGLQRASVSTSREIRCSQCSLWRWRTNTIKATAKVSSHTPRELHTWRKEHLGIASCLLAGAQGEPSLGECSGSTDLKHRFFYRCFHHSPQVSSVFASCPSPEPGGGCLESVLEPSLVGARKASAASCLWVFQVAF